MEKTICPLCEFDENIIVGIPIYNSISQKLIKSDYKIVRCTNCMLYFVSPAINFSDDEWQLLYDSNYFEGNTRWLQNKRKVELQKRLDKLNSFIDTHHKINFLDIGCGQGYGLINSQTRGWDTTGLDIQDNRIELAKVKGINFHFGNLTHVMLQNNFFDIIYLDSVLEHVLDPMGYLGKIKDLLRPGGVVYIGIPNEDSFFNDIRKISLYLKNKRNVSSKLKPFDSPYHVVGFNRKSLNYIVNKSGLKQIYFKNFSRKLEFLGFKIGNKKFWEGILLVPFEFGGMLIKNDIYFEVILQKCPI